MKIDPIVKQIIDRDCHVSWSNRRVIYHVISRLKHKRKTFWALPRRTRRALMRQCVARHAENFKLYAYVMGGNIK